MEFSVENVTIKKSNETCSMFASQDRAIVVVSTQCIATIRIVSKNMPCNVKSSQRVKERRLVCSQPLVPDGCNRANPKLDSFEFFILTMFSFQQ